MTFCPHPDSHPGLAFAFGRRFGNAVERNRARRRLRAAFSETWDPATGPSGVYLLAGNRSLLTDDYQRLLDRVGDCLDQLRRRLADRPQGETPQPDCSELVHTDTPSTAGETAS